MTIGFLPEMMLPEHDTERAIGAREAYREMIKLELSRSRSALGIWQDLVDGQSLEQNQDSYTQRRFYE
jgi:hypothetical protein